MQKFVVGVCCCWLATSCAASRCKGQLEVLDDVALQGGATRFDYQAIDAANGRLFIAHMGDDAVEVVRLSDGSSLAHITGLKTARGIAVAPEVSRVFVTTMPNELAIVDAVSLSISSRIAVGNGPDGVAWDPVHRVVAISDQRDGAISLIGEAGDGTRTQLPLGGETGNVAFDPVSGHFWITVVAKEDSNVLAEVDSVSREVLRRLQLPGCRGAHGLRIEQNGKTALVACENNATLLRVDLGTSSTQSASVGDGPDVLAIDEELFWLYVASESGTLSIFDLAQPGLIRLQTSHIADHAHSVSVDSATHRVFFPLQSGSSGRPMLKILRPQLGQMVGEQRCSVP